MAGAIGRRSAGEARKEGAVRPPLSIEHVQPSCLLVGQLATADEANARDAGEGAEAGPGGRGQRRDRQEVLAARVEVVDGIAGPHLEDADVAQLAEVAVEAGGVVDAVAVGGLVGQGEERRAVLEGQVREERRVLAPQELAEQLREAREEPACDAERVALRVQAVVVQG